jgi:hypothetical protein
MLAFRCVSRCNFLLIRQCTRLNKYRLFTGTDLQWLDMFRLLITHHQDVSCDLKTSCQILDFSARNSSACCVASYYISMFMFKMLKYVSNSSYLNRCCVCIFTTHSNTKTVKKCVTKCYTASRTWSQMGWTCCIYMYNIKMDVS